MGSSPPKSLSDALAILARSGDDHFGDFTVRCGDRNAKSEGLSGSVLFYTLALAAMIALAGG